MKPGDMVRFAKWTDFDYNEDWSLVEKKRIGILVDHDKLMGQVTILYKGELLIMRSQLAEKAGKKDGLV